MIDVFKAKQFARFITANLRASRCPIKKGTAKVPDIHRFAKAFKALRNYGGVGVPKGG